MKRICTFVLSLLLVLAMAAPAFAADDSNVTYDGSAQKFIFAPGSKESVTDLFPEFRGVMPGDTMTEEINV